MSSSVPQVPMSQNASGQFCPNCGTPWQFQAVACPRCGWRAMGAPMATQRPRTSVVPTVLVTFFFNLFGTIPAAILSERDRQEGHGGGRQWTAFAITLATHLLLWVALLLFLPAVVVAILGTVGLHNVADRASADVSSWTGQSTSTTDPGTTTTSTAATTTTTGTRTATGTATRAATTTSDADASARADLEAARTSSLQALGSQDGQWVEQLSSKAPGTTDASQTTSSGSHTFQLSDIDAQYRDFRDRFTSTGYPVYVLRSTDFGKQLGSTTYWTVVAQAPGITSRADADEACQQMFPTLSGNSLKNACLPRQYVPAHS